MLAALEDHMSEFARYFPHNNYNNVLRQLRLAQKRPSSYTYPSKKRLSSKVFRGSKKLEDHISLVSRNSSRLTQNLNALINDRMHIGQELGTENIKFKVSRENVPPRRKGDSVPVHSESYSSHLSQRNGQKVSANIKTTQPEEESFDQMLLPQKVAKNKFF